MSAATKREEVIFDAASKLANREQREAYLERACADDPGLRERVEELLASQADADHFFNAGISALRRSTDLGLPMGAAPPLEANIEEIGTRIHHYKLLQKLGEGGCGVVYMAEQEEPVKRRVALKVIKLGMDTRAVIARFQAERQVLALMDHPNIARVLDAGATETGRPYFVMELVHGVKITEYCDDHHLDITRRLELCAKVCQAIQHAHQKGIIHRDIKPSNVLVTVQDGLAVPKVIDFGIAKATEAEQTDRTPFTIFGQFIGTPAYMSPEQAGMSRLDVDTRSDIYSLGVLLYELLTGKTPFDNQELLASGLDEMRRTLREREPHRPSAKLNALHLTELKRTAIRRQMEPFKLVSELRGDLDWIVMKALEKDRTRRYETANGLAMDIQRLLKNEPVMARPPSGFYRFQKLVRRNRVAFAATTAVTIALLGGFGTSMTLFFRERDQRQRAVEAEQRAAREKQDALQDSKKANILLRQMEDRQKISQAALLINQDQYEEADSLLDQLSGREPTLEGAAVYRTLGEWHAVENRWQQAADRLTVLLKVDQLDGWSDSTMDVLKCGAALIELGDMDGYERFRQEEVNRFIDTANPNAAERIIKISLLTPADEKLMKSLATLASVAAKPIVNSEGRTPYDASSTAAAWRALSLSVMEYRRADYPKAIEWCQRCIRYGDNKDNGSRDATVHIVQAMAYYQQHQNDKARAEFARGQAIIEQKLRNGLDRGDGTTGFWFDWIYARVMLREATDLMEKPNIIPDVPTPDIR